MKTYAILAFLAASAAAQTTHTVTVGGEVAATDATGTPTPQLLYNPESIQAAAGDVVEFHFMQKNHTVTQSSFANPCVKNATGFDSGFMPNPDGAAGVTWSLTVNDTTPIWAYCKQKNGTHCGKGMVFSINALTTGDKTFSAFKQLAIEQNGTALTTAAIAATAASAVSSTVTIAAATVGAATASVVAGNGFAADGSACGCSCLCGSDAFPSEAAVNNFGGFAGMLPSAG